MPECPPTLFLHHSSHNNQTGSCVYAVVDDLLVYDFTSWYVTKFWKITLMGVPEIIRIFEFTTILLTPQKHILNISTLFFVIQSIFTVLET